MSITTNMFDLNQRKENTAYATEKLRSYPWKNEASVSPPYTCLSKSDNIRLGETQTISI